MPNDHVHTGGSRVWVRDEKESWVKGEVVKIQDDGSLLVRTEEGKEMTCKPEEGPLQNPDSRGVEDMTRLPYLHEPGVLWNLKCRYTLDDIYTYTGTILIAVNPFISLPHLYGTHMMEQYRGVDLGELSPHVYAIADAAYKQMRREMKGQSILVSGESGAGKTETSKLIMKYLAYMGGYSQQQARTSSGSGGGGGDGRSGGVEEQVLESNPLLEAFGNAKTVRNDNSSRFGKYVEINFNKAGVISGAAIRTYLLERSRVVAVNDPERNYHIFYQLCDGASPAERQRWRLKNSRDYHYLNQSSCYELPGVNNADEYKRTLHAMTRVGIPGEDQEAILRTVAAVLWMGNIEFKTGRDDDAQPTEGAGEEALAAVAYLLGVDEVGLRKSLTTRTRNTPDGPIVSPLDAKAAVENRDSLAKTIYSKLFDWLVARVNVAIGEDKSCAASVGVLDIYGFESFKVNDFEQFCINLANEKLQQHFNQHVFKMEQAEYEKEKIDWSYIQFVDNQDVLDLIEGKMGILDLLDEQCRFPTSKPKDLAQKLYTGTICKDSKRFSKPKRSDTAFTIDHYAGDVTYETTNFLDKNKDFVVAEHQALLTAATVPFIVQLFHDPTANEPGADAGKAFKAFKFNSVGSQFKRQLADLMAQLFAMQPHYIRCIKPNSLNKPALFEQGNVLHQLRCGGVLEAVRISCAGFPSRFTFFDFVDHFWQLSPDLLKSDLDDREITRRILSKCGIDGYQLGETKVFLKSGQMAMVDKMRTELLNAAALTIQRCARGWLERRHFIKLRRAAVVFQCATRAKFARRLANNMRQEKAALTVQRYYRGYRARKEYTRQYRLVTKIQSMWRGRNARNRFMQLRLQWATTVVQTLWRQAQAQREYNSTRRAALSVQCAYRSKVARRALRQLKQEAREGVKLLEDKKALEAKVLELQQTLEVVQNQRNELRQQMKDEKAATDEAKKRLSEIEAEKTAQLEAAEAQAATKLAEEAARAAAAEQELVELKKKFAEETERLAKEVAEMQKKHERAQDFIHRTQTEMADKERKWHAMREDLITRVQNACGQRDEAREEVMAQQAAREADKHKFDEELAGLREELAKKERALQMALAAAAAAPAAGSGTPGPAGSLAPAASFGSQHSMPMTPSGSIGARDANGPHGDFTRPSPLHSLAQGKAPGLASAMYDNARNLVAGISTPGGARTASMSLDDMRSPAGPAGQPESELDRRTRELQARQQQLIAEKRKQEEERLLSAISGNLGYHRGRPLAAVIIFRSCLQWRAFQADRTSLFDRIIGVIGSQIERQQEDNAFLAYWLTNTVTLLHMLQKNIKPASGSQYGRNRPAVGATTASVFGGLFKRAYGASPMHNEASIHGGGVGGFKQVEAKYPALLFKQQLDAFVQKIFPLMRDNVKKAITPMLANCIHTPKGAPRARGGAHSDSAAQAALNKSWGDILGVLDGLMQTVKENHVPRVLVQALMKQLFSFINVQLFNQLLLRRECCSFTNGEYVKTGLAQVELWIQNAGHELVADSWDELKYIRQAVTFLVIGNKPKKSLEEITTDLCPVLSIQQLYRISTMYWDDKYNTETVSSEVLARMKQQMVETNASSASHSFLLDDDSTLPFAAADVLGAMDDKDLYMGLPVPEPLREGDFSFLEKEMRLSPPGQ